jgi:glycosyltransferase involved in cell wall biosynthesis
MAVSLVDEGAGPLPVAAGTGDRTFALELKRAIDVGGALLAPRTMSSAPMAVGLDVSPLDWPGSGIARYTYELCAALMGPGSDTTVVPVAPRRRTDDALPPSPGPRGRTVGPRFPSRAAWTFGLLPLWLRRSRLDVFHSTSYYAPLASGVPTVVTIHDLSTLIVPETHPRSRVIRARLLLRQVGAAAAAIITPSESVRADVAQWLDVPLGRIHVVPGAAAEHFRPVPPAAAAEVARRYGLEPGYFLSLGTVEPRKNIGRTIQAVGRIGADGSGAPLVIAGRIGWRATATLREAEEPAVRGHVRFLGHVPEADLPGLVSAAAALVYPSLHEGFGLPIVEAMACATPVITSVGGATAETAGGAALTVDPLDVDAIAAAMRAVRDPETRSRLSDAGRQRAATFSWSRSAAETVAVYEAVRRKGAPAT